MDAVQPAGWYPDPSGMPDTFRWWDGVRWTQALSPRADAPPPPAPKPVVSEDSDGPRPASPTGPSAGPTEPAASTDRGEATEPADQPASSTRQESEPAEPSEPAAEPSEAPDRGEPAQQAERSGSTASTGDIGTGTSGELPAGASAESGSSTDIDDSPVPPPAGSPGPEYLPPPARGAGREPASPGTDTDEPDHGRQNLRSVVVLATVLVLLAGVGIAAWLWWPREDDEMALPPPQQTPSSNPPEPSPSPAPTEPSPSPSPTEQAEPSESARLMFEPLGGNWKKSPRLALLSNGYAETQVTQPGFDGRNDWIAVATVGTAPPTARQGSLDEQARAVASWFRNIGFEPMKVNVDEVDNESVTVDGRPAHLLVQRLRYDNPDLRSRSDLVTVVVVDMGEKNPPGVFLASVPNTHEQLGVDVDNARRSLHITE